VRRENTPIIPTPAYRQAGAPFPIEGEGNRFYVDIRETKMLNPTPLQGTNTNTLNVITVNESPLTPSLSPSGRGEREGALMSKFEMRLY